MLNRMFKPHYIPVPLSFFQKNFNIFKYIEVIIFYGLCFTELCNAHKQGPPLKPFQVPTEVELLMNSN